MLGVLGDLVEDVVAWVEGPLRHWTDSSARVFRRRGGSAANVAAFAAELGAARFLGCVGDDPVGVRLVAELERQGVDVRVARRGTTGTVVVVIDDAGERTMLPDRGAATMLERVPPDWLDGLAHLHVPAYSFDGEPIGTAAADAIARARAQGSTISVDASSTGMLGRYGAARFLALMEEIGPDLIFANAAEAGFLGLCVDGRPGPHRSRLGSTMVVTKAGARPTTIDLPGAAPLTVAVPAQGDIRDSTGAGDAFAAGFLQEWLRSADPRAAAAQGHSLAARVLSSPGASVESGSSG